jgi:hypothetical protein
MGEYVAASVAAATYSHLLFEKAVVLVMLAMLELAELLELAESPQPGPTICSGRTHSSNCSAVTYPSSIAACLRVVPSW